ncbi:MAG: DUF1049 domain-containing protein [Rickettsiales bacterium]|nr:DUF1049 domain-containing protein [Rickettsiales bacterium]
MLKIIFNMLIITFVVIFSLFNQDDMALNIFNVYEIILPKFFLVVFAFATGFLLAVLIFSIQIFSLKMRFKSLSNKYNMSQQKLENAGLNNSGIKEQIRKFLKLNES